MGAVQNYVTVNRRPPDFEDYIDMLRRHRSWIIGPTYAGLVIAVMVAFFWPDTFEASAVLRVTPQVVSERVVPETIDVQMAQLLDGLRTKIQSRSYLTSLISNDKLKLYPRLVQHYTMEDAIAQMAKDVSILPYGISASTLAGAARGTPAIQVKFRYTDKYKAKAVVDNLVSEFMNQQVTVETDSAKATHSFLASQLQDAQTHLDDVQGQIVKFRQDNAGRLPENAGTNQNQLSGIEARIQSADERINGLNMSKRDMENNEQTAEDMLALLTANADETAPSEERTNQDLANLDKQIEAENATLAVLRTQYYDSYPKVKDEQTKIAALKAQRDQLAKQDESSRQQDQAKQAQKAASSKAKMSMQQQASLKQQQDRIAQIKIELENYDHEIQRYQNQKLDLEKQRIDIQAKINASPEIEQQYGKLLDEQAQAKQLFDELTRKEKDSETTQDIQERHLGEQLEVLDPAQLPQNPVEPNRWAISGAGVGIGLMIGLVLAGAKEAKDTSLKNLKDVRAYTNLPVLTSIPLLENALLVRRKRRLFWLGWSTAILVGSAAMFIAMTYYMTGRGGQ